jgi:trimeric autotransporter adhesin
MKLPSGLARCVLVAVAVAAWTLVTVEPAGAAIAFVRKGSEITASGTTITLTLSVASTNGDLLVATISDINGNCSTDSITAPSGWVKAAHSCRGTSGPVELWYHANSPSTSSVVFNTGSSGANTRGQLSEFSGVATTSPLDKTGTANNTTASTSLAVTTTGTLAASGEVAVTAYNTATGLTSITAQSGWNSLTSDASGGFDSDYKLSPTSGATLTETATSSPSSTWGAVIATFKPPCSGGSLSMNAPASTSFTGVTLDGTNKTTTASVILTPDDERGTSAGWNITGTSTTFTTGTRNLSTTATTTTGASAAAATGNCTLPTNSVGYPVTLPAGASPPTAVKLYNAALSTGAGPTNVTLSFQLAVPANTYLGTYTSTWTFAIVSGP